MVYSKQLIPNILLSICLTFSIIYGVLWTIHPVEGSLISSLNYHQVGGIIAVIINYIFYYKAKRLYKYSIFFTLILGLINVLIFTHFDAYITLSIGQIPIRIQIVSFLIIMFVYIMNFSRANNFIFEKIRPSDSLIGKKKRESIDRFKSRFREYDLETLSKISESSKYDHFASMAASELIKEIKNTDKD